MLTWIRIIADEEGAKRFMKSAEIEKQVHDSVKDFMDKFFN